MTHEDRCLDPSVPILGPAPTLGVRARAPQLGLTYSGKHKKHGMNLQVIASPDGDIVWASGALPGLVHDKNAEWIWAS